jgi:hypothetical protein
MQRPLSDPAMMERLGRPESLEHIWLRPTRFVCSGREPGPDQVSVIIMGAKRMPAGMVVYWER